MKFSKFFSKLQEQPWYTYFLKPVVNTIGHEGTLLDIGTGTGKLIQLLSTRDLLDCVGVDTNSEMLNEAKLKLGNLGTKLIKIEPNTRFLFDNVIFDYITICSVLFNLKEEEQDFMLNEAMRMLKNGGKLIILTPTGNKNVFSLTWHYFSLNNLGIYIWYRATKSNAKLATHNNYVKQYANHKNLNYNSNIEMNGFSKIEMITK